MKTARDYKHVAAPRPARATRLGGGRPTARKKRGWLWLLGVIAVGVAAIPVYHRLTHPEHAARHAAKEPNASAPSKKPEDASARPRYQFYELLPKMEVVVPESELQRPSARASPPATKPRAAQEGQARYLLQAGSFTSYAQADRVKAQLALIGVEATIQSVAAGAAEHMYRVRIGPFHDLDRVRDVRTRLKHHAIEAIVLKVSG